MYARTMLLALAVITMAVPKASAGRWDFAFDGGWMRVLIDVDQAHNTLAAKVYQASPGGSFVLVEGLTLINAGDRFVLQGPITSGTFKVGLGGIQFTTGDFFTLTVFKNGVDVNLVLKNATTTWSTVLTWF